MRKIALEPILPVLDRIENEILTIFGELQAVSPRDREIALVDVSPLMADHRSWTIVNSKRLLHRMLNNLAIDIDDIFPELKLQFHELTMALEQMAEEAHDDEAPTGGLTAILKVREIVAACLAEPEDFSSVSEILSAKLERQSLDQQVRLSFLEQIVKGLFDAVQVQKSALRIIHLLDIFGKNEYLIFAEEKYLSRKVQVHNANFSRFGFLQSIIANALEEL